MASFFRLQSLKVPSAHAKFLVLLPRDMNRAYIHDRETFTLVVKGSLSRGHVGNILHQNSPPPCNFQSSSGRGGPVPRKQLWLVEKMA